MNPVISLRRPWAAVLAGACGLLLSHAAAALDAAELEQLRGEIAARSAENHKLRSRYVMESARFAKAHHPEPCVYDVGVAEDTYESALGAQSAFIDGLAIVAESPAGVDQLGSQLEFLPRELEKARVFENTVAGEYAAVRDAKLSKSVRACHERRIEAARLARQKHEETLLVAARYVVLLGGGTAEEYAERRRRVEEAERTYFAEQAERRKITEESAALLLVFLMAVAQAAATP